VKWLLLEADSQIANDLYAASVTAGGIVVPPQFFAEVANAVRRQAARGLITTAEAHRAYLGLEFIEVRIEMPATLYRRAFDLADRHRLAAIYDSIYVALAELRGCDLWTADRRLYDTFSPSHPAVKHLSDFPSS
jgi:predicted nucleic acid-binding protein